MSAAKKAGKAARPIRQEELRRLMREKQREASDSRRVESPYARYSGLGQLSCALCAVPVKSERLWAAHVLGRQHKEKAAELKGVKGPPNQGPEQPPEKSGKRKAADSGDGSRKRTSGQVENPSGERAGVRLLAGVYDDDDEEEEGEGEEEEGGGPPAPPEGGGPPAPPECGGPPAPPGAEAAGLPADFFDSSLPPASSSSSASSSSVVKAEVSSGKENTAEALPEGFFDDPVRDAKVRNVEAPQDHMDREWEEFQKEMRQVNSRSEAMVAEEDEEGRLERQIHEIDQQMECYRRVELLRDRRDEVRNRAVVRPGTEPQEQQEEEEEDGEEEEEELLGLLSRDWRAKGAMA